MTLLTYCPAFIKIFSCCPVNISDMFFTSFTFSDLGAGNYANLKSSLLQIKEGLPPEEFLDREVGTALEVNTLNEVIIFWDTLNSSPEVPSFKGVLWTEGLNGSLEVSALLDWKGLADTVDELEFRVEVDDVHLGFEGCYWSVI